ncbi:MAG: hypothetical protein AAF585_01785, partial [Verrucomicrobiota bacterium]
PNSGGTRLVSLRHLGNFLRTRLSNPSLFDWHQLPAEVEQTGIERIDFLKVKCRNLSVIPLKVASGFAPNFES